MRLIGVTILLTVAALAAIFLIGGIGLLVGRWSETKSEEATSSTSTTTPAPSIKQTTSSTGQTTTTTTTSITNTTPTPQPGTSSAPTMTTTTTTPTTLLPATSLHPPAETTQPITTTTVTTTAVANPGGSTECEDNRYSCKKYQKAGFCTNEGLPRKVKSWLLGNCKLSCGVCDGSESTTTTTTISTAPAASSCSDRISESTCQRWVPRGGCHKPKLRYLCKKSCQACESTDQEEETSTSASSCSNKASSLYCFVFSMGGLCSRKPDVANNYCEKKCGLCSPTRTVIVALVKRPDGCNDRLPNLGCRALTSMMGCKKNTLPALMCSKTCQLCDEDQDEGEGEETDTATATKSSCHDVGSRGRCSIFAQKGQCSSTPDLAYKFCKETCGLCSQSESAADSTSVESTQPCDDKMFSFGCKAISSFWGCSRQPATALCRKTCQLCDVRKEEDDEEEAGDEGGRSDSSDESDSSDGSDSEMSEGEW